MRVLLLGAGGMLAREILAQRPAQHSVVSLTRAEVDIRDPDALQRAVRENRPTWVINGSGYTDVDAAESDSTTAFAVNSKAVGDLARFCRENDCGLLHFSTDYVFDGMKDGLYAEDDATNPISVYGASKLAGEKLIRESATRHLILRTRWLYGKGVRGFISTLWERAHARMPTKAADDQFACSTYTVDLARTSWAALSRLTGTFHVVNRGLVSPYILAKRIFEAADAASLVSAASLSEFPAPARRPLNSPLDVRRIERALGYRMPSWEDALERYVRTQRAIGAAAI